MGRKNKPTALHKLHGTGNSTRMRARRSEPAVLGDISLPPDHLSPDQKMDWFHVVANAPAGVLGACDRGVLEVYIVAADHHRIANRAQQELDLGHVLPLLIRTSDVLDKNGNQIGGGNIQPSPYLGIISRTAKLMARAAAELGFRPISRAT